MNTLLIKRLILKDWHFLRVPIISYLALGAVSLILIMNGGQGAFFAGSVLLITVLISMGIHLAFATIVNERKEQTLPFIMSLPISYMEFTTAKILANLLMFLIPWAAILIVAVALFAIGNVGGIIPFTVLLMTEIFTSYILLLAVSLVSESQSWSIGAMVFGNLFLQAFLYGLSQNRTIGLDYTAKIHNAIWSPAAVTTLAVEIALILLMLGLTFFFQARKTDFI